MELQKCSVSITADLFTATTFLEMEFFNPNAQEIEGLYRFRLQPGQAITAFQLDLSGKFRDGSIEEKWKAANAYNTIVGKRVDPALLQMDGYNSYSLRIYPVPAKGTRRITLTVQQLLKAVNDTLHYFLPLTCTDKLQQYTLLVDVHHTATKAFGKGGLLKDKSFTANYTGQRLSFTATDFVWDKAVSFSVPLPPQDVICLKKEGEKTFFALRHSAAVPAAYDLHPKSIAVFWDASFSGRKRDTEKELSFLKQYIAYHGITQLTVVPFHYKTGAAVFFNLKEKQRDWMAHLRNLRYEGATQLGRLDFGAADAGVVFLVSDGYKSFGAGLPKAGKKPVFCVHACELADNAALEAIIGNSGGKNIDLQKQSISQAIAMAGKAENKLLDIRTATGKTVIDAEEYDDNAKTSLLAGTTTGNGDTLLFEYGTAGRLATVEKVVLRSTANCTHTAVNRIPALAKFDGLLRKAFWQDLLFFGKDEKIVTYNTSYIVLEKADDYVKFDIEPPKELEEECGKMQPAINVRNNREEKLRQRKQGSEFENLSAVAARYNERIKKWGGTELISLTQPVITDQSITVNNNTAASVPGAGVSLLGTVAGLQSEAGLSEVVVIGYGTARRSNLTGAVTVVRANEIPAGTTSVEQALSGRVAGLMITANDGFFTPSLSSIRIRGTTLLNNGNPLFVVDGIPVSGDANGRTNINDYVAVADIQQISVLKDASAAAVYGSRGANGVIVIQTKRGGPNYRHYNAGPYKLKAMEDVDYLQEIKTVSKEEKWAKYNELQRLHETEAGFYLDMAQHLYECGWKSEAVTVITTAAELLPDNLGMQRTVAFFLQQWGERDEAIALYEGILKGAPANPLSYRDLALAYAETKKYQKAIDLLYGGIRYDYGAYEPWQAPLKELLLNDLNAIVALHRDELDLSGLPAALLKPLPVDLRIVLEGEGGNMYGASVVEPSGKSCREWQQGSESAGYFTQQMYNYNTKEYEVKEAAKGRYKIRVNYYGYYSGANKQPAVIRLTVYKNFGKPTQTVTAENIMMDNQSGEVEISEVVF